MAWSKDNLLEVRQKREQEALRRQQEYAERQALWHAEYLAAKTRRAQSLFDDTGPESLSATIAGADRLGLRKIWLTHYRVTKTARYDELYECKYRLDFEPDPAFPPTQLALETIRRAGFECGSEHYEEDVWSFGADGDPQDRIGSRTVHTLWISW